MKNRMYIFCSSSAQVQRGAMVFNHRGDNKSLGFNTESKSSHETDQSVPTSTTRKTITRSEGKQSSWGRFPDEDYIVFCFKDDGAVHVVKDGKTELLSDHVDCISSTRPVNRKEKKKWSSLDMAPPMGLLSGGENHIEETEECEIVSAESSDSNQSDSSSSSFAFPVLNWEGMESPAQMPKPDTLQLRKHHHKPAWVALLQCCRF